MTETKSRTQHVREILERLGVEAPVVDVQKELRRLTGKNIHETAIYNARREARERQAMEARRAPQPPAPAPAPVVVSTVEQITPERAQELLNTSPGRPANPLLVFAEQYKVYFEQMKKVKTLAVEVGGYDNLLILTDMAKQLKD